MKALRFQTGGRDQTPPLPPLGTVTRMTVTTIIATTTHTKKINKLFYPPPSTSNDQALQLLELCNPIPSLISTTAITRVSWSAGMVVIIVHDMYTNPTTNSSRSVTLAWTLCTVSATVLKYTDERPPLFSVQTTFYYCEALRLKKKKNSIMYTNPWSWTPL